MSGGASSSTSAPNTALYVKNIPSKIKKPELRRQLYALFVTYGKVLDVVATRQAGMREQAFVVFQDLASSTAALRALDGFSFYGRALSIDYAKGKSRATIIAERGLEALSDPSLGFGKDGKSLKRNKLTYSSAGADLKGRERKRAREEAGQRDSDDDDSSEKDEDSGDEKSAAVQADGPPEEKRRKADTNGNGDGAGEMQMADSDEDDDEAENLGAPIPALGEVPNNLLFVSDIPSSVDESVLTGIIGKHAGFTAVQVIPAKAERTPPTAFAFAEFTSTRQAASAASKLQGHTFPSGEALKIGYAKRATR